MKEQKTEKNVEEETGEETPISSSYNIVKLEIYDLWKNLRHRWGVLNGLAQMGKYNNSDWNLNMGASRAFLNDIYSFINNMSKSWSITYEVLKSDDPVEGEKTYAEFQSLMSRLWVGNYDEKKQIKRYYKMTFEDLNFVMSILSIWMEVSGINKLEGKFVNGKYDEEPVMRG